MTSTCMSKREEIRVAICICTFRRRQLLRELLAGIARLTFRKVQEPQVCVVVIDNDELGGAEEVCRNSCLPWAIRYGVEPTRGISKARNRAITEAGTVDFIAFIDDDEVPSPRWLDELLWAQANFNADVVAGPVLPNYDTDIAEWIKRGKFFESRRFATGAPRKTCACNNVLIADYVLRSVPRFDEAFGLSGAEDTDFFLRVRLAGHKIIWSQEAEVFESVSSRRGTVSWLLRREYQTGNGWVFCERGVDKSLRNWLLRFCKAGGHVVLGSAAMILRLLLLDKVGAVRSLQRTSMGTGMLVALFGHRFFAYKNAGTHSVKFEGVAVRAK